MSWYSYSWQHMASTHDRAKRDGYEPQAISKAIDESYPYSERSGYAYKAWLAARKDFFRKHDIPLRRAKKPSPDLLSEPIVLLILSSGGRSIPMANALDHRPLLVRLNNRIEKYQSCISKPLATDLALHAQSVELIGKLVEALKLTRENLRACQGTIHLAGGFDPAYVDDAQAATKIADAVLAEAST